MSVQGSFVGKLQIHGTRFNQINVKLLISIQILIFQLRHSHPLLTLRLGYLRIKQKKILQSAGKPRYEFSATVLRSTDL